MYDLLKSAVEKETNREYSFFLQGDLCQMATQKRFLSNRGFDIKQNDVYPCLKNSDVEAALFHIFTNRVEGWWHYKDQYVKFGICIEEEFKSKF